MKTLIEWKDAIGKTVERIVATRYSPFMAIHFTDGTAVVAKAAVREYSGGCLGIDEPGEFVYDYATALGLCAEDELEYFCDVARKKGYEVIGI